MAEGDRLSAVYAAVPDGLSSPWQQDGSYRFDRSLLRDLIAVQVSGGSALVAASGGLAIAVDVWIATELRRAGIEPDAVWPRPERPRLLPASLSRASARFRYSRNASERAIQKAAIEQLERLAGAGRSDILGGLFFKEIDVVMADYDRGLELGVSTKTMTASAAKNVGNRFEEAAGDLLNIRKRYPLATFGYAYLVTANVPQQEPAAWERIKDMLHKLTTLDVADERESYDACCLIVADWASGEVVLREDLVPSALAPDQFFNTMLRRLLRRSPVSEHHTARELLAAAEEET
jgi:hypothetical protein